MVMILMMAMILMMLMLKLIMFLIMPEHELPAGPRWLCGACLASPFCCFLLLRLWFDVEDVDYDEDADYGEDVDYDKDADVGDNGKGDYD